MGGETSDDEPMLQSTPAEIQGILEEFSGAALIGLEYLVEISRPKKAEPVYSCLLCQRDFPAIGVMDDVLSAEHRVLYLVSDVFYFLCSRKATSLLLF